MEKKRKVLIVDDQAEIRELVATIVRYVDPDAEIEFAESAAAAHVLDEQGFDSDLTITDWDMGSKGEGADVVGLARNRPVPIPVIVMSGSGVGREAMRLGASVYLQKPFAVEEMMTAVRKIIA